MSERFSFSHSRIAAVGYPVELTHLRKRLTFSYKHAAWRFRPRRTPSVGCSKALSVAEKMRRGMLSNGLQYRSNYFAFCFQNRC